MSYIVIVKTSDFIGASIPNDDYLMVEPVYIVIHSNLIQAKIQAQNWLNKKENRFDYVVGTVTRDDWAWRAPLMTVRVDAINIHGFQNEINDFEYYHDHVAASQAV